jgi:hypothetical protein
LGISHGRRRSGHPSLHTSDPAERMIIERSHADRHSHAKRCILAPEASHERADNRWKGIVDADQCSDASDGVLPYLACALALLDLQRGCRPETSRGASTSAGRQCDTSAATVRGSRGRASGRRPWQRTVRFQYLYRLIDSNEQSHFSFWYANSHVFVGNGKWSDLIVRLIRYFSEQSYEVAAILHDRLYTAGAQRGEG